MSLSREDTALISAALEDRLDAAARAAFWQRIATDATFADAFAAASLLEADLFETQSPASKPDVSPPRANVRITDAPDTPLSAAGVPMYRKGYEPQPFKLGAHHVALAAAALLAACGLAAYLLTATVDPKPDPVDPNQSPPPVATLIQNTGNLRTPHGYPAEGDDYGSGEYALSSGTAEFMLTNAVNVKLRGRSRLYMRNDMNVALTRGSAEFVVPKDAKGFTVHLPDESKIVDLGTAFKVEINDEGQPRLRVTKGSVEWTRPDADAEPVLIAAGQTASLVDGQIQIASTVPLTSVDQLHLVNVVKAYDFTGSTSIARHGAFFDIGGVTFTRHRWQDGLATDGLTLTNDYHPTADDQVSRAPDITSGGSAADRANLNELLDWWNVGHGSDVDINIALADGNYRVQYIVGVSGTRDNELFDISAGTPGASLGDFNSAGKPQNFLITGYVTVSDGLLKLRLTEGTADGGDNRAIISGLIINSIPASDNEADPGTGPTTSPTQHRQRVGDETRKE